MSRSLDLTLAFLILVLSLPLMLIVALAVRVTLGSPVIFSQLRIGKNNSIFVMYKFRTMIDAYQTDGELLPDAERLTQFGRFLRSTSLDELPELWNVIKGDMSLVGPRPLLIEYLEIYSEENLRRHEVRPGITGLAQVSGRNQLSWEEKFKLDVSYVETRSLVLDLRILASTIKKVLLRTDVCAADHETMPKFTGKPK